jgi:hypothetical protein
LEGIALKGANSAAEILCTGVVWQAVKLKTNTARHTKRKHMALKKRDAETNKSILDG